MVMLKSQSFMKTKKGTIDATPTTSHYTFARQRWGMSSLESEAPAEEQVAKI
jgi:hypothetical protein